VARVRCSLQCRDGRILRVPAWLRSWMGAQACCVLRVARRVILHSAFFLLLPPGASVRWDAIYRLIARRNRRQ